MKIKAILVATLIAFVQPVNADIVKVIKSKLVNSNIFEYQECVEKLVKQDLSKIHKIRHKIGIAPKLDGFTREDKNGKYKLVPVDGPGGASKGNPYYKFLGVEQYFRYSKETMMELYNAELIIKTGTKLQRKYYLEKAEKSRKTVTKSLNKLNT
jgi:adenine-specific DNA-methyltransferase